MDFLRKVRVLVTKTGAVDGQQCYDNNDGFTFVKGTVIFTNDNDGKNAVVGSIFATIVKRKTFDEDDEKFHMTTIHNAENNIMQWIGRTWLRSLCQWDYHLQDSSFLYITKFDIIRDNFHLDGFDINVNDSDIATAALYHFLRDPKYIWGQLDHGHWNCSSAAVIIPHYDPASGVVTRNILDPFIRNGFYRDSELVRIINSLAIDNNSVVVLVSSYRHWSKDTIPLTQAEVSTIRL